MPSHGPCVDLWQSERHQGIALAFFGYLRMPACRNYDELFAALPRHIGHRRRAAGSRKLRFPEFLASFDIEGPEERVDCPGDKDQSARSHDWPAKADGPGRDG